MATAKQKKEREDLWLRVAQGVVVVFVLGALIWYFTIGAQISTLSGKIGQLEALVGTKLDALTTTLDRSTGIIDKATAPKPNEPPPVDRAELKQLESGVMSQATQLSTRIAQLETLLGARLDEVNRAVERSESNLAKALERPAADPRVETLQNALSTMQSELGSAKSELSTVKEQLQAAARETDSLRQDVLTLRQPTSPPSLGAPTGKTSDNAYDNPPTNNTRTNNTASSTAANDGPKSAASWLIAVAPTVSPSGRLVMPVHLIDAQSGLVYTWHLSGSPRDQQLLMARLWGMAKGCDPEARPLDFLSGGDDRANPVNRLWLPASFALGIRAQDVPTRVYREFLVDEPLARATNRPVTTPEELVSFLKVYPRLLTAEALGRASYQR